MGLVPNIRRHWSDSSQFVAPLPRLFPVLVEAGGAQEHLYLEEPQCKLKKQGFWLKVAICCSRTAGLSKLLAFVFLMAGGNCHQRATCTAQVSFLLWVVVKASWRGLRVAFLSQPLSLPPLLYPAALVYLPSYHLQANDILPLVFLWFFFVALIVLPPPSCLSALPILIALPS